MRRDIDRAGLPGGSAWNLLDWIPDELGVPLAGRGGWTYAGGALSGATSIKSTSYAPFPTGGKVLAVDQAAKLWDVVAATAVTGTATIPGAPPAFHRGRLLIPNDDGVTAPTSYDGTTLAALAGSPPTGQLAAVYKDHAILGKSTANANRIWFSGPGDPTSWNRDTGYWDTTGDMVGIGILLNVIILFHGDTTERLRGTIPPPGPGDDMILEPFLDFGCIDPFSIVNWTNRVVWASAEGIFMTDGASWVDLTAAAEMKTYWQQLLVNYTSSWRIAAAVIRDKYIISLNNGPTLVDCLSVDLIHRTITRMSNLHGSSFVHVASGAHDELYMGMANAGRVAKLSTLWVPSSTVTIDGDGTAPTPILETGALRGFDRLHRRWIQSMGKQKWRFAYLDYDLRAPDGGAPTMTLSYGTTPTGAYTAATPAIPATSDYGRARRSLSATVGGATRSNMLTTKLAVTGPYTTVSLFAIEGAYEPIEIGQL